MKLLVTNYEGTIAYENEVMNNDIEAIKAWREAGNLFVIATGRSFESIQNASEKHGIQYDYLITNNGGMVFDRDNFNLYDRHLDYITSLDIMYIAKETDGVVSYVVSHKTHRYKVVVNENLIERRFMNVDTSLSEDAVMDLGDYTQISISMAEMGMARSLADAINSHFYESVWAYANGYVCYIVPRGVTKESGLDFVIEFENLTEYDVYVLGNSYNDIPLIEYGPNGACIDSATDDVKEFAPKVYNSISEMINEIL